METIHTSCDREFRIAVEDAVCKARIRSPYKRVMVCGKGVVILPDTNRNQDCEMPELLKALGLKDKAEPVTPPASASEDYIFQYDDVHWRVLLTPDQIRLVEWLSCNELLVGCLDWNPLDKPEII